MNIQTVSRQMNLIKKFRSAHNRLKTNHPVRTMAAKFTGATGAAATAGWFMMPLDGGVTLLVSSILGSSVTGAFVLTEAQYTESRNHTTKLTHNGKDYVVTEAQKEKYMSLQYEINTLKGKFKNALNKKTRRKISKKAQRLADYQDDIIDSKNVMPAGLVEEVPEFKISYKHRKPGN